MTKSQPDNSASESGKGGLGSVRSRFPVGSPDALTAAVMVTANTYGLSSRESKVLVAFGSGKSEKEIGRLLQISPRTVETYLANIQRKLHVDSRSGIRGIVVKAANGITPDENDRRTQDLPNRETPPTYEDEVLTAAIERATEVIGDRQEAMRWLGTPVRALNFAPPISLLATSDGAKRVIDVLGQMEHGVW